ncbi:prephenate dehydrogenase [Lacticaseibacillus manihotivorans]|jgi:prephenate dehydrogenase|uniref:Prephenate dehydrogenase n=2 Tax=Lacticaseibacillus manihotivorans TaxID=88233 RepID=A0A0R1QQ34_9LACO|nr:prephenate dehydrogenase [Lacticaseibacillus manihotivorans]KRL44341.1 prephenate dehydrogenase [Lacticaseibacillus manihotivorans DSM 13343 = JCM 12514]QFQ91727.1 prephenate dehydrogenase/arogenate dehydrogenase family protein [Lacticaseibacillus manihotivorans]
MTTVFIEGLGLIGSSLARAIRQRRGDAIVIGHDQNAESLKWAKVHQVIDVAAEQGLEAAGEADIIILATPVSEIVKELSQLSSLTLKPGVIVTDTGSTKATVMQAAQPLMAQGVAFVGGHPMAGSERSGVQAGRASLFAEAHYFLVNGNASEDQILALRNVLSAAGAYFEILSAKQHDQMVAQISHVPHVVASALAISAAQGLKDQPQALQFSAGGFRDTTRIAAGDPTMWTAIMQSNTKAILKALDTDLATLQQARDLIAANDRKGMHAWFEHAQQVRQSIDPPKEV